MGLGALGLPECQAEHAVLVDRLDSIRVDALGQPHAPAKATQPVLADQVVAFLAFLLAPRLTLDGEHALLDGDVDVLGFHARQRRLDDELVALLIHVQRGPPALPGWLVPRAGETKASSNRRSIT